MGEFHCSSIHFAHALFPKRLIRQVNDRGSLRAIQHQFRKDGLPSGFIADNETA